MCNFRCSHCYSQSGPLQESFLPANTILQFTSKLKALGYTRISISGGEPSVYPEIERLCKGLKDQSYGISVISNGWQTRRLLALVKLGLIDEISVSFDGLPVQHDKIRGRLGSFKRAILAVSEYLDVKTIVGAVVSVSGNNLQHIPNLVDVLAATDLDRIQLHPLALTGRAASGQSGLRDLDGHQLLALLINVRIFQELYPNVSFHCDAVASEQLAHLSLPKKGDLISPLVITETGNLLPISYDLDSRFSLGNICQHSNQFSFSRWHIERIETARGRCQKAPASTYYAELTSAFNELGNEEIGVIA
ncbi:radical SAM protein [Sphingorhabdus sp. Alg231-15]|uniref:radical SAM protein n=1 Tax=Sphingorhabdus sp. Alg231-15 TaxID=1922222 RepID=UPI00307B5EEB